MVPTSLSSREFSQDASRAKRAARNGPVFITDRGRPAHVLLTIEEYRRLTKPGPTLFEALGMEGGEEFDFDPPRLDGELFRPAEFD